MFLMFYGIWWGKETNGGKFCDVGSDLVYRDTDQYHAGVNTSMIRCRLTWLHLQTEFLQCCFKSCYGSRR